MLAGDLGHERDLDLALLVVVGAVPVLLVVRMSTAPRRSCFCGTR
jgi:hypothetical protein